LKTHTFNLITVKRIREALDTIMIAKPERVLKTLNKNYNIEEIKYIKDNLEYVLDYMDEEVRSNGYLTGRGD
jgi:hypothetical protein